MSEWIKCSERLPDKGSKGDFLVWVDNGKTKWTGIYTFDEDSWGFLQVTHWMPLPPAPEEE